MIIHKVPSSWFRVAFTCLLLSSVAVGQKTWTGTTSSAWSEGLNWSPSGVPGSGDSVTIPDASGTPNDPTTSGGPAVCGSITIAAGSILEVAGGFPLTISTDLLVDGTLNMEDTTLSIGRDLNVGATGVLDCPLATSLVVEDNLFIHGTLTAPQALVTVNNSDGGAECVHAYGGSNVTLGSGVHTVKGALRVDSSASLTMPGKVLFNGPGGRIISTQTLPFDVDVDVAGTFILTGPTLTGAFRLINGSIDGTSNFTLDGPGLFTGGTFRGTAVFGPSSNVSFSGSSVAGPILTVLGSWSSDANFMPSGGSVTFAGGCSQSVTITNTSFLFYSVVVEAGTCVSTTLPLDIVRDLTVKGTLTSSSSGAHTVGDPVGTIQVDVGGVLDLPNASSITVGEDLHVHGTLGAPQAVLTANNTNGSTECVHVYNGSSTTLGNGIHTIKGPFRVGNTASLTMPGKVLFNGGGGSLITSQTLSFDVDVDVAGTFTLTGPTLTGTFHLISGMIAGTSNFVLDGPGLFTGGELRGTVEFGPGSNVSFSGTLVAAGPTITVLGSWSSDASVHPNGGSVTFAGGPSTQAVTSGNTEFWDLIVTGDDVQLAGVCTVKHNLTVNGTLTVMGPLHVLGNTTTGGASVLELGSGAHEFDGNVDASGAVAVDGVVTVSGTTTLSGALSGSGTIDCDDDASISATTTTSPTLQLSANLSLNSGDYAPTSGGCVIFDGTVPQVVTQTGGVVYVFPCLEIRDTASVTFDRSIEVLGDTQWDGDGTIAGQAQFDGDLVGAQSGAEMLTTGGNVIASGDVFFFPGLITPSGIITLTSPGSTNLDVPQGFGVDVEVGVGNSLIIENVSLTIGGDLRILSGTVLTQGDLDLIANSILIDTVGALDVQDHRIELANGPAVTVYGELAIGSGGELALAASAIDVADPDLGGPLPGGTLHIVGAAGNRARMTGGAGGGFSVQVRDNATIEARHFLFEQMGTIGLRVEPLAILGAMPLDLRDGVFDRVAAGGVLLDIARASQTQLENLRFQDSAGTGLANMGTTFNVRVPNGSAPVSFADWSGGYGGPDYEDDGSSAAFWGSKLAFFVVREHATAHALWWRTLREEDVLEFRIEREPVPAGIPVQVGTMAASGPQVYQLADTTITPATSYRYRLIEVLSLTPLVTRNLGERVIDGLPNPVALPHGDPSVALPVAGNGPGGSSHGSPSDAGTGVRDLQGLLVGDGRDRDRTEVLLGAGRYAPFDWQPRGSRHLRIAAEPGSAVVIDARNAPVRIHDVPSDGSVDLSGVVLLAGPANAPALLVENCQGPVLLDGLVVRGGDGPLMLSAASAVVMQGARVESASPVLLAGESSLAALDSSLAGVTVERLSGVVGWGLVAEAEVEPEAIWALHGRTPVGLEIEMDEGGIPALSVDAPTGSTWRLFAATGIGCPDLDARQPVLLGAPRLALGLQGLSGERMSLPPDLALAGPLYLQAVVELVDGTRSLTPVRTLRP